MRLTACLLHYRRPHNMPQVIESLMRQTHRPRIFIWNNSGEPCGTWAQHADWLVDSSENKACLPRWWMAAQSPDDLIVMLDDDLALVDNRVLGDAVDAQLRYGEPNSIMGAWGVAFTHHRYDGCEHVESRNVPAPYDYLPVDMVKGRFMVLHRRPLQELPLHSALINEDDIAINGMLADGQPERHKVLRMLGGRFKELPAPAAWSRRPGHEDSRQLARERFFPKSMPSFYG